MLEWPDGDAVPDADADADADVDVELEHAKMVTSQPRIKERTSQHTTIACLLTGGLV